MAEQQEIQNNNSYGQCSALEITLFKEIVEGEAREMLKQGQTQENIALFVHYISGCKATFWKPRVLERRPNMSKNKEKLAKLTSTFVSRKDQYQVIIDIAGILENVGVSADLVELYKALAGYTGNVHSDRWLQATPAQIALLSPLFGMQYDGSKPYPKSNHKEEKELLGILWNPTESVLKETTFPSQIVTVTFTSRSHTTLRFNRDGENALETETNSLEFMAESLHLVIKNGNQNVWLRKANELTEGLSELFKKSGNNLRSLFITGASLSMAEMYKILSLTPNLRVLKVFEEDYSCGVISSRLSFSANKCPPIKHLTLGGNLIHTHLWIMEAFATQLVTLEVGSCIFWDCAENLIENGFPNLKSLKLDASVQANISKYWKIPMPRLERLSIPQDTSREVLEILKFASGFPSLLELTLNFRYRFRDTDSLADWEPQCFPNLTRLCLINAKEQPQKEKLLFSCRFPKLEILRLLTMSDMSKGDARMCSQRDGHWNISPTLKTIEWLTNQLQKANVENHIFTREN